MNKVVVLRLILIACIGSFMGFIVAQQWHQSSISTPPEQALCDASQQWCGSVNGNQAINMRVTSSLGNNIITPANIKLAVTGAKSAADMQARITGVNMYMGQFDLDFERQSDQSWQANTPLPSCNTDAGMIWQVSLLPPYSGDFYFTSSAQGIED